MNSYKFETIISNRTILLPRDINLDNKLVEIIINTQEVNTDEKSLVDLILTNNKVDENTNLSVDDFVNKYLGTLIEDTQDSKLEYLMEKYK